MPLKRDTKKNPFRMYSNKFFLKDSLHYNHWFGHSVIKPVDVVVFQKRKALREGINYKIDKFVMYMLDEGELDKLM